MKKVILFYLSFYSLCFFAQKQFNYKAIYNLNFKTDSNSTNSNNEELILLLQDNKESFFQNYKRYQRDSINNSELAGVGAFLGEIILTDNISKAINISDVFDNVDTFYKEPIPNQWKIKNTESSVNGIKCREATLQAYGRVWTACYSEDYPFQFGSYFFAGLPGLILSVEDDQKFYQFKLQFFKKENNAIKESKNGFEVSKVKFYEMLYDRDFSGSSIDKYFAGFSAEERLRMKKKYKEKALRRNTFPIDQTMQYLFKK